MDLGLLTSPDFKPWLNIVANSYIATGDGTFGSDGSIHPTTGIGRLVAFSGYAPTKNPSIAANSLYVGSTFTGAIYGTVVTEAGGAQVVIEVLFEPFEFVKVTIDVPDTPAGAPRQIRILFDSNAQSVGVGGFMVGTYTAYLGGSPAYPMQVFQGKLGFNIDTTASRTVSILGGWNTASPDNVLRISNAWMKRAI